MVEGSKKVECVSKLLKPSSAGRSARLGWAAMLLAVALLLVTAGPVAAIPGEGCAPSKVVYLPDGGSISIDLRFRPAQSVNIAFTDPPGSVLYSEHGVRTDADGEFRATYTAAQIGFSGGNVYATAITGDPCTPEDGAGRFVVTVGELPATTTLASSSAARSDGRTSGLVLLIFLLGFAAVLRGLPAKRKNAAQ